jgi:hypothetical protein
MIAVVDSFVGAGSKPAPTRRYHLKQLHIIAQILIRLLFFRFIIK